MELLLHHVEDEFCPDSMEGGGRKKAFLAMSAATSKGRGRVVAKVEAQDVKGKRKRTESEASSGGSKNRQRRPSGEQVRARRIALVTSCVFRQSRRGSSARCVGMSSRFPSSGDITSGLCGVGVSPTVSPQTSSQCAV